MFLRRALVASVVALAALASSCSRKSTPESDTSKATRASADVNPDSGWAAELGQMLIVPGDSENAAVVLFPRAPSPHLVSSRPLALFNTGGDSIAARLTMTPADAQQCGDAPIVHMRDVVRAPWAIGLLGRSASMVRVDSIESMASGDSARLAADLSRLASSIPIDADSRFVGLPFAVLAARKFDADGKPIVLAHLVRRVNQEATPLEEHTLVIAQRGAAGEPASLLFSQRSEGKEETAEHFEILSVAKAAGAVFVLIARDQEAQTEYEILERSGDGTWRERWRRTLTC